MIESPPGPEVVIGGQQYLYFGGTGYLGLANHPEVIEAGCTAMRRFGLHSAVSRSGIGTNPPVEEVECRAAQFFGKDESFYFSSGYVASHVMVLALAADCDVLFVEETAHSSAVEAARLAGVTVHSFSCERIDELQHRVHSSGRVLVMADAVQPATGVLTPVMRLIDALRGVPSARLLLDDAHGFGVLGPNGRGLLDELGLWAEVNTDEAADHIGLFVCGTLSKGLGGFGGIIPGSRSFIARVKRTSYFGAASAPAAAVAAGSAKALEIIMREPQLRASLHENVEQLRCGLRDLGLRVPEGHAAHCGVGLGSAERMQQLNSQLRAAGIFVPYLAHYNGVPPEGILRITVSAGHSRQQIRRLIDELTERL